VRELIRNFKIVPVDDELVAEIAGCDFSFPDIEADDAIDLGPLLQALRNASAAHFALICTQYFGGVGNQTAVLFGEKNFTGPFLGPDAINGVLERLGIRPDVSGQRDSFSVAGLERWRSTEDLIKQTRPGRID
jgi:hypothetical protein